MTISASKLLLDLMEVNINRLIYRCILDHFLSSMGRFGKIVETCSSQGKFLEL